MIKNLSIVLISVFSYLILIIIKRNKIAKIKTTPMLNLGVTPIMSKKSCANLERILLLLYSLCVML